jgi:hypothetical protein
MRLSRLLPCAVLGMVLTAASASAQNANVTVIHGIPGLPQPVSVFANNGKLFDFDYGQQRGPLSLAPGNYALEVRLGNTPVLNLNASLMADTDYTVIAHLDENGNNKLSAFVNDVTTLGMGKSRLVVRHTAEAPAVDVRLNAPNFTAGFFQNLSNPNEVQADVDAGNYEADIFVAGTSTKAFGPAQLALEPGYSYIARGRPGPAAASADRAAHRDYARDRHRPARHPRSRRSPRRSSRTMASSSTSTTVSSAS